MYEYNCRLVKLIDSTTIEADIYLGFDIMIRQKIRLYGIQISELSTEKEAIQILNEVLDKDFRVKVIPTMRHKRGRVMAEIFNQAIDGALTNIKNVLIARGAAVERTSPAI